MPMLGIPPEKPTYVCELCCDGEKPLYQFDYRIAGNILAGKRKKVNAQTADRKKYPFAAPGFPEPHFDLMFYMEIPWVSEEPNGK
ncbi:MAG: hypothetical protein LUC92_04885 [Clostridiales bacterium]|nr:hypothetical protein [Clostridiales bacterium]